MDYVFWAWFALSFFHIGLPAIYYLYMRHLALHSSYGVEIDDSYEPTVSIIIPTYNEESVIKEKLENMLQIEYPKNKLEIIVVDSASTDETVEVTWSFIQQHSMLDINIIQEKERRGKGKALNYALGFTSGEVVTITDAECLWPSDSLKNAVKYLADSTVGAVTGVHVISNPNQSQATETEQTYRSIYRILRIGESKMHSTPIFEGELAAFRRSILEEFEEEIGADDTGTALKIIRKGCRAIAVDEVKFYEPTPYTLVEKMRQKTRRGQHLIQAFVKNKDMLLKTSPFSKLIFPVETYLYILNPFIFLLFSVTTLPLMIRYPFLSSMTIMLLLVTLVYPTFRKLIATYLIDNLIMISAVFQELRGQKQLTWEKIQETR